MAAAGARAAAAAAGHWISRDQIARNDYRAAARFSPGPQRNRLCRGREHSDRLPLGRADGTTPRPCSPAGPPAGRGDRHSRKVRRSTRGQKRRRPPAEASAGAVVAVSVERRAGAKGNTHQQSTYWNSRTRLACHRRWSVYGNLCRHTPDGAVCGKAARTDLGGGRAMKRTSRYKGESSSRYSLFGVVVIIKIRNFYIKK